MLLVVWTYTTVIRASVANRGVVPGHLLGRLDEDFSCALVIVDVVRDLYPFCTVLRTSFQHPDPTILEHNLGVDSTKTGRAY